MASALYSARRHTPAVYAVSAAAGDAPALPAAAKAALADSARSTLAAAAAVSKAVEAACPWLDAVLERLIAVVCQRAEDGPDVFDRWAEPDWSVVATSVPVEELRPHGVPCDRSGEQEEQHDQDRDAARRPLADFEGPQRHPVLAGFELAIGVDNDGDALAPHPSNGAPRINSSSRARSSFE